MRQLIIVVVVLGCLGVGKAHALIITAGPSQPTNISNAFAPSVSLSLVTSTVGSTTLDFNNPLPDTGSVAWYSGGATTRYYLAKTEFDDDLLDIGSGGTAGNGLLYGLGVEINSPVSYFEFTGICSQCDLPAVFLLDSSNTLTRYTSMSGVNYTYIPCTVCGSGGYGKFSYDIDLTGLSVSKMVIASNGASYIDSITVPVPEPTGFILLMIGLTVLWGVRKNKWHDNLEENFYLENSPTL